MEKFRTLKENETIKIELVSVFLMLLQKKYCDFIVHLEYKETSIKWITLAEFN